MPLPHTARRPHHRRRRALPALVLAVAALAATTPAAMAEEPTPTLSLSGTGEVTATPDMAVVTLGVATEAETARAALDQNNAAANRLLSALKEAGLEDRDIATSGVSVEPRMVWPEQKDGNQGPPRIVGYTVSNTVRATVRDLARLGEVLDKSVTAGGNRIDNLSFSISDDEALLDEARAKAMQDAMRKAHVYATTGGFRLKRILSVTESGGAAPPVPMMARDAGFAQAESVPVSPGETTLRVRTSVTWEIEQ